MKCLVATLLAFSVAAPRDRRVEIVISSGIVF